MTAQTPPQVPAVLDSLQRELARQHALVEAAATRSVHVTMPGAPQAWWDTNTFSALAGAIIGGLLVVVAEAARARLARGTLHRTSLVRLERACAAYLKEVTLNMGYALMAENAAGRATLFWKLPHPFEIETSFAVDIFDLDMNKRVASVNNNFMRYNRTVDHLRRVRESLQAAQLGGTLDPEVWVHATRQEGPQWAALQVFLSRLDDSIRDLKVRAVLMVEQYDSLPAQVMRCFGLGLVRSWPLREAVIEAARQELNAAREVEHSEHMKPIEQALAAMGPAPGSQSS